MIKYTQSSVLDTFDFIKKTISFFDILFQVFYIAYLSYRFIFQTGNQILNIILLVISAIYFVYHLITLREFYTKREIYFRKAFKAVVKLIKYIIRLYVIVIAVLDLYNSSTINDNITMLITVLMILGLMFSVLFDIVLIIINKKVELIKSSICYDAEKFREDYKAFTLIAKKAGADFEKWVPPISNQKIKDKIIDINHKQEKKAMRKRDFKRLKKK